ncbi:MAG: hypothetical protein ACFE7E_00390 [Candidatus Hodarchaeota archaeon]
MSKDTKDLEKAIVDLVKGLSSVLKKLDDSTSLLTSRMSDFEKRILSRLENLENQFSGLEKTKDLIDEISLLVPVLHISNLLNDVKGMAQRSRPLAPVRKEIVPTTPAARPALKKDVEPVPMPASKPLFEEPKASFKEGESAPDAPPSPSETRSDEEEGPDVVVGERVPSYIKKKVKPKSIWEGIRDEE